MKLFLLRHGEAGRHADDALRELTPLGEAMARAAAQILLPDDLRPSVIVSSPILRARQTAALAGEVLGGASIVLSEYLTPYADHRQIFGLLKKRAEERILLVGHEPHLSTMVSLLVTGSRSAQYALGVGTLVLIACDGPAGPSAGRLEWIRSPLDPGTVLP